MNAFLNYCVYRAQPKEKTPPSSPIPPAIKCCANFNCNSFADEDSNWLKLTYSQKHHYFCTEYCKNDWLNDPSQIGSWSPPTEPEKEKTEKENIIPVLQLN